MNLPASPRICIVLLSAVGDVVHALPLVCAIKRHRPQAHITWLLDVDAIRRESGPATNLASANRNRLLRSLLKRARLGDLGFSEKEIPKLWREIFPSK